MLSDEPRKIACTQTLHWHGPLLSTSALPDGSLIRVVALEHFLTICHPVPSGVNSPKGGISSHIMRGWIGLLVIRRGLRGSIGHWRDTHSSLRITSCFSCGSIPQSAPRPDNVTIWIAAMR